MTARENLSVIAIAVLIAVGTAIYVLRTYSAAFNTPDTELSGVAPTRSAHAAPQRHEGDVVFIVVDGLGFDQAMATEELDGLRRVGVTRPLVVDFPTFTSPSIVTMVTGVHARDHGLRLNGAIQGVASLDTILESATRSGLTVRVRPRQLRLFAELLRPPAEAEILAGRVAFFVDWVARRSSPRQPGQRTLWLIHFDEVDEAGHEEGSASELYRLAARRAAGLIGRIASDLDFSRDTIVVVSDHGHLATGGHGGDEPEVRRAFFLAAGAGVAEGLSLPERPLIDVASTMSVIAGIPNPGHNLGFPMLDVLRGDRNERARALANPFDQVSSMACRLYPTERCGDRPALVDRLTAGDATAVAAAEDLASALSTSRRQRSASLHREERWLRWGVGFPLIGATSLLASRRWRRPASSNTSLRRALVRAAPLIYVATYAAVMLARGYGPSFSLMAPQSHFVPDAIIAVSAAALVAVVVTVLGRADPAFPFRFAWQIGAAFAALAVACGADPAALVEPTLGVLVFQLAPLVVGVVPVVLACVVWSARAPAASESARV